MKWTLIIFLISFSAYADSAPELGNFSGLLFTGSALHQPIQIESGTFSDCEFNPGTSFDIYSCLLQGSKISVKVTETKTETYNFDKVKIVSHKDTRH